MPPDDFSIPSPATMPDVRCRRAALPFRQNLTRRGLRSGRHERLVATAGPIAADRDGGDAADGAGRYAPRLRDGSPAVPRAKRRRGDYLVAAGVAAHGGGVSDPDGARPR